MEHGVGACGLHLEDCVAVLLYEDADGEVAPFDGGAVEIAAISRISPALGMASSAPPVNAYLKVLRLPFLTAKTESILYPFRPSVGRLNQVLSWPFPGFATGTHTADGSLPPGIVLGRSKIST